jgi:hypothetical protein
MAEPIENHQAGVEVLVTIQNVVCFLPALSSTRRINPAFSAPNITIANRVITMLVRVILHLILQLRRPVVFNFLGTNLKSSFTENRR